MMKNYERNKQLEMTFNMVAKHFETVGPSYFTHFGHLLIHELNMPCSSRVLDVACGRGALLKKHIEVVGGNGDVVGVDFSKEMIDCIKKDHQLKGITCYQMDAEQLSFNSEFDFVTCGLSLHFFSDPIKALNEMYRVLVKGGKVGISTWAMKEKKGPHVYEKALTKVLGETRNGGHTRKHDMSSEAGLMAILSQVGFEDIEIKTIEKTFYYDSKEVWWEEQNNNGTRGFFERIKKHGDDVFLAFKEAVFVEIEHEMVEGKLPFHGKVLVGTGYKR